MNKLLSVALVLSSLLTLVQCSKKDIVLNPPQNDPPVTGSPKFSYGDSIFYLKASGETYTISPVGNKKGKYTAIPNNLQLDEKTGAIKVRVDSKDGSSQTGLWYKIFFESGTDGKKDSTLLLISGVNYVDEFYEPAEDGTGDTIISPIYNGKHGEPFPKGTFSIKENKFSSIINSTNGQINISKLHSAMKQQGQGNSESPWVEVTVKYRLEDKSNKAENSMTVLLYYYYTPKDSIPKNVTEAMNEHRSTTFGLNLAPLALTKGADETLPSTLFASSISGRSLKPRPPCVVIVGN